VRIVLDASACIEVVLNRAQGPAWAQLLEQAEQVLAPDLFVPEVTNTIWKYHRYEHLTLDTCEQALEFAIGLVDVFVPSHSLYREAFLLARAARQPAYDMFYMALAQREDAGFLTLDVKLKKEAERRGVRVL
jgi:predicted nucleic acid-binding protein